MAEVAMVASGDSKHTNGISECKEPNQGPAEREKENAQSCDMDQQEGNRGEGVKFFIALYIDIAHYVVTHTPTE
jgi:hypothetical protein